MEFSESESWTKKPWLGQRSEEFAAMAGTIPITCSTAERWSPVTLVGEFMDWRSFRRIPWVRVAIVADEREREEREREKERVGFSERQREGSERRGNKR